MAYFLAKTDPDTYALDDLAREGTTVWDGVRNPQAVAAIRAMAPGDIVLVYHSGGEAAIVGAMTVTSPPRPDPHEPKSWVVDVRFLKRLATPITLRAIKESGRFAQWSLVRQGRLSTMGVPEDVVAWLREQGVL